MLEGIKKDYDRARSRRLSAFYHGVQNHPEVKALEAQPGNWREVELHEGPAVHYDYPSATCSFCAEDRIAKETRPSNASLAVSSAMDVVKKRMGK